MTFLLLCLIVEDFWLDTDFYESGGSFDSQYFIPAFGIQYKSNSEATITMMYYSFTSLSTVGFGDLHPKGDYERVIVAVILLFGVSIFSYIMGIFISLMD